jgi:ABC-type transporter Mla subunit MlaD
LTKIEDTKKVIGSLKSKDRQYNENVKDTKGVFRSLTSKDRQYNENLKDTKGVIRSLASKDRLVLSVLRCKASDYPFGIF